MLSYRTRCAVLAHVSVVLSMLNLPDQDSKSMASFVHAITMPRFIEEKTISDPLALLIFVRYPQSLYAWLPLVLLYSVERAYLSSSFDNTNLDTLAHDLVNPLYVLLRHLIPLVSPLLHFLKALLGSGRR